MERSFGAASGGRTSPGLVDSVSYRIHNATIAKNATAAVAPSPILPDENFDRHGNCRTDFRRTAVPEIGVSPTMPRFIPQGAMRFWPALAKFASRTARRGGCTRHHKARQEIQMTRQQERQAGARPPVLVRTRLITRFPQHAIYAAQNMLQKLPGRRDVAKVCESSSEGLGMSSSSALCATDER